MVLTIWMAWDPRSASIWMHGPEAERLGPDSSVALKSWWDTEIFSPAEGAALVVADTMTHEIAVPEAMIEP